MQHTTEFVATSEESIRTIALELSKSRRKLGVWEAIYSGGAKPKNAAALAERTGLKEIAVLQLATPMAHKQYFEQVKFEGRVAFRKYQHFNAVRGKILRLARNPKALGKLPTSRTPKVEVVLKHERHQAREVHIVEAFIDDIDEFRRVRPLTPAKTRLLQPRQLPEKVFKYGIATLLGNKGKFRDWGGERNDLFSTHTRTRGRRMSTAFAFKGKATPPPLTPKKLGTNGDQIQRLFKTPAQAFLIQYEGPIAESVLDDMQAHAIRKSLETKQTIYYGVIALEDSHRLRTAYPNVFTKANVPRRG